ncbi:MAG: hypothetical protein RLY86_2068 [Pseudomonadota bacterium]|jgi:heme oxygenase
MMPTVPADTTMPHLSALERLRLATRSLHDGVEATGASARILAATVDRGAYAAFLARTLAVIAPVEAWLEAACTASGEGDPAIGRRSAALRSDLAVLRAAAGHSIPVMPPDRTPAVAAALDRLPRDRGTVLGVLYVLEGSLLGGSVIARHIADRLGPGAADFTHFHAGQGERVGDRWRTLKARLNRLPDGEVPAAEQAAVALFGCFLAAYGRF